MLASSQTERPKGYKLNALQAIAISQRVVKVRTELRKHPGLRPYAYIERPHSWQVSYFDAKNHEKVQVHIDDPTATATEAWTGYQVLWRMARGYPGSFGRSFNAIYVWLPLGLIFLIPFIDFRQSLPAAPPRHADAGGVRGLALLLRARQHRHVGAARLPGARLPAGEDARGRLQTEAPARAPRAVLPVWALALAVLFLVGFRVGLNMVDSNVIDVGYAGVTGADYITHGHGLYNGTFPADNLHGDTYGPINYLAYVPFEQIFPWSGRWDDLPAAHAATIVFDLLTLLGLFLLGRRLRAGPAGTSLGVTLAFAWAAYPYSLFVVSTNSNDSLVAAIIVYALLALASPPGRGILIGLGGAAKFAPLALAPLFARGTDALRSRRTLIAALTIVVVFVVSFLPFIPHGGVHALWNRTIGGQLDRNSPFSVWGQTSLDWLHKLWEAGVIGLALLVAVLPKRRSEIQVAALAAAVVIAFQIAVDHWFYLYIVWFAPLVFVALFAPYEQVVGAPAEELETERYLAEPALV